MGESRQQDMMYTVRVASTKQEISFCLPSDQQPPQKIRLHNGNTSIALFNFEKKTNSYVELTKEELESFNRGYKTGRCRHSEVVNREMGDERYNKRLAKLQRKLKEKTKNEHQCSYCEEYGGVINIQIPSSDLHVAVEDIQGGAIQIKPDDLKLSQPEVTVLGSSSIKISWARGVANNEHLAMCTFELQMSTSKNSPFSEIYSGSEQTFTQIHLLPGTKYYFRLRAVQGLVKGPFSPDVCVVTDATAPSNPDVPHISNKTRTSVVLKWTTRSDNGSPVMSYILQWDEGNLNGSFQTIYEGSQKQYKFNHNLPPVTSCRFRVKAINKIGESEFSPELHFTNSAGIPSVPDPPELTKSTANCLQLSWKKPNANGAEITEFIVEMDDENKGYGFLVVYRGSDPTCTVDSNLKRNTTYKFRLRAINSQGQSKWSDVITHSTISQPPGVMLPPVLEGKVHTRSFVVTWAPSNDDGGCEILSYHLEIDDGKGGPFHEAYAGLDMNYKFQSLLPGHTYNVRVSCASSQFRSPWSDVASITTLPVIPDQPSAPRESNSQKPQPHTIELLWDPPTYNGGATITNYNVQMKKLDEQDFKHIYFGPKTSCCASGLPANCNYAFRVRAQNSAGDSKFSEVSCISTGPGAPDTVQQLEPACRSSSIINISWKVPKDNGTPVTGYNLEWAKNCKGPFEKLYSGVDNWYDVKKCILPSTMYYFRVQASSAAGYGCWSDVASCKTPAAPPGQITHLKVVGQTSSSLTLQWREPCNSGADITSYNIDIIGHQVENYVPSGNETSRDIDEKPFKTLEYTLLGLQPNTQYRFRVQGVNKSGCGAFSLVITATTRSIPPEAPSLEMVNVSHQSVKLQWKFCRPQSEASETNYDLQIRCWDAGSFETIYKGSAKSHKVSKLCEQSSYGFRVRAANEAGYGPYSDVRIYKTGVQPPASVKGLTYSNLSKNKVTLSWNDVSPVHSGDSINYILERRKKDVAELEKLYQGNETVFTCNNLIPEETYGFRVCAVRILVDGTRIQSSFTPLVSLTVPSELKEMASDPNSKMDSGNEEPQIREFTEKQLAMIFFFGFAVIVLLTSASISFFVG